MELSDFMSQLEGVVDDMMDDVAVQGLTALKRILDDSGFADSPFLKNYEMSASVGNGEVEFEILLDSEAVDEESRRKMRKETETTYKNNTRKVSNRSGKDGAKEFVKTYTMSSKGRPERIVGMRDGRRHKKDGRTFQRDMRKISSDRLKPDALKTSGERYVEHELSATAPRGMDVDESGKLRIAIHREIRNTKKKVIFPQGDYQGIVKKFVDEMVDMIETRFAPELEKILAESFK